MNEVRIISLADAIEADILRSEHGEGQMEFLLSAVRACAKKIGILAEHIADSSGMLDDNQIRELTGYNCEIETPEPR